MRKTKTVKRTWLGRKGETYDYVIRGGRLGKRVSVHRWLDTNEVEIRLIEGDGRTQNFKEYQKATLNNPTDKEIMDVVKRMAYATKVVRS